MKSKSVLKGRAASWAFSLFSLVFLGIGGGILYSNYSFMKNAVETVGTVIYVAEIRDDDGTSYKPTVRFSAEGREYEAESWMSSSGYNFRIGEEIPVLYDINEPTRIRLNYFMEKWGFGGIFAGVGGGMFIASLFGFRKRKPKGARTTVPDTDIVQTDDFRPDPTDREERDVPVQPTRNPTVRRR